MSLQIQRRFTKALEASPEKTVYDLFAWKRVDVLLRSYSTGEVLTDMRSLEFPENYSQSACDIIASKYFRKTGVPNERGQESSMREVAHRLVGFWARALRAEGLISGDEARVVCDELAYMLLAQIYAPNSPQFFNTGLEFAYGINGPGQGHFYYDEAEGRAVVSADAYARTQGSACFIISVRDSLLGEKSLTHQLTVESLLFKYGSGVGTNWSPIRSKDESLSGGGKSSGLLSFLKVSDRNAGAIKSGGTTRRAAKMNILNLDHPEITDYINWKAREEDKVEALAKMGYSASMEGEAYETVSGQNANNSVRVPDRFMRLVGQEGALWETVRRTDGKTGETLDLNDLWEQLARAAWRCGDPGVQFDDTINAWHTCPCGEDGAEGAPHNRVNASNPCSEYMFLDDTACNLASVNVVRFYDKESGAFDAEGFTHAVGLIQLALEATIAHGQFPTADIARKSFLFRPTGLGLTNLGALFMLMGLPYDSDAARAVGAALCGLTTARSYHVCALMAERIGPFPKYDLNASAMKRVLRNHAAAAGLGGYEGLSYAPAGLDHEALRSAGFGNVGEALLSAWKNALEAGEAHGYRNAQVSVLAPTGTIAFAMDCATTSSEPFFSHVAYKKLVGGGFMEIVNPVIPDALKKLGYSREQIDDITAYVLRRNESGAVADGKIEGAPHLREEHLAVFDTASRCGSGRRFIEPAGHVRMMGALTPHISGAISKTVNMPPSVTPEDVKELYALSWRLGVKAIALYRDGCKACQPLSAASASAQEKPLEDYTYAELLEYARTRDSLCKPRRVKPSGIRTARVHEACLGGLKLYITTSFYEDGRLGEVYVSSGRQGSLTKGLLDSLSTTISEMLQYGVPPKDIAKMYRGHKYEPSGFITGHPYIKSIDSISDLISKIIDIELGDFDYCQVKPEGYASRSASRLAVGSGADFLHGELCPSCKSHKMVKNGVCKVCAECGTTTGCS
ncbi:MAG: vitamin B12-dependent ribonucleotide reductase [Clostridiales bacterium]|jgi:ribonucleoside-diphosphate reductase alpha chain|nr:vitamin B12-dependent ribonucleotide reductase [Clostridiales bacterium]